MERERDHHPEGAGEEKGVWLSPPEGFAAAADVLVSEKTAEQRSHVVVVAG